MAGAFLLVAVFASALGVMYSLWCRTSMRAIAATLATGLFLGGLYLFCCIPIFISARMEDVMILYAPCIPFLLLFPGMTYLGNDPQSIQPAMVAAYVIGIIGYAFASWVLIAAGIRNFDYFTGRTRPLPWDPAYAKPRAANPLLILNKEVIRAEIVEEP
jgi:hypothetical protein